MRQAVVRHGVRRDHHRGVRPVNGIGDRRAGDVVVVGGAREAPGVAGVRAGGRVRGVAHVDGADGGPRLAVHPSDRVGRRVRQAVVRHGVRRDHDRGVRLVDDIRDGRGRNVVVVGGAREAPRVAGVRASVRVRRVERDGADGGPGLAVHPGDRVGRRVRQAIVRHGVRRDHHRRVRLQHVDMHGLGGRGVVRRVIRRELHRQALPVAGIEDRGRCRVVDKRARHVRRCVQLRRGQRRRIGDVVRVIPRDHRRDLRDSPRRRGRCLIDVAGRVLGAHPEGVFGAAERGIDGRVGGAGREVRAVETALEG